MPRRLHADTAEPTRRRLHHRLHLTTEPTERERPMTDLIHVDVSEHQAETFDNTYTHQFGMFRVASEWDRPDTKAPANLTWCVKARAAGGLVNFGVYVIPGNVPNDAITGRLDDLG